METRDIAVAVDQLTKIFPSRKDKNKDFVAVDHISFELKQGEILGLLGPNGAGKTTTIQMLLSTLTPTSGIIKFFGRDFAQHRSWALQHVGFASTYVNIPHYLTVYENLAIHGRLYGMPKKDRCAASEKFLKIFGAWDIRNQMFGTLSAGQKTRVTLAKVFMTNPRVVFLDEPTAALDPDIAQDVRKFIRQQQQEQGVSILFTSHNMSEVTEVCDRVMVLQAGKIIADDTPTALAASISTTRVYLDVGDGLKRTIAYVQSQQLPYQVEERWITIDIEESKIAELLTELARAGVIYTQIWVERPTLEDYFLTIAQQTRRKRS
ncbi:MAG: ABC transporter ATP-binding protein [Candidatus Babeliales bacterium]|jgi:ABC-2 type transport system ATP-binding protein